MTAARKRLIFTLTAGRTGTQYLANLLQANLDDALVRHEVLDYDAFGFDTPELSHLLQFNTRGNTAYVQAFWQRKLQRMLALPHATYAETSHQLMKAGLVENLPALAAQADVHLILLQRDWGKTIRSYLERHPRLDIVSRWMWYLDPDYASNLVPSRELLAQPDIGFWYWYLCEVYTRAEYYRLQLAGNPRVQVTEVSLERIATEEGAAELLTALGAAAGRPVMPARANENDPMHRMSDAMVAQLEARLAVLRFDVGAAADRVAQARARATT